MSLEEDRRILKSGHPENFQFVEENSKYYDPDEEITEAQLKQFEEDQKKRIEEIKAKLPKGSTYGEDYFEEIEEINEEADREVLREGGSISHMQNFDEVEKKSGVLLEGDRQLKEEERKAEIQEDKKILGQSYGSPGMSDEEFKELIDFLDEKIAGSTTKREKELYKLIKTGFQKKYGYAKVKESWSESVVVEAVGESWNEEVDKEFKISGTAIVPGLSLNNKRYTEQAIAKAYEKAKKRVESGNLYMKAGHRKKGSQETSPLVRVGKLTEINLTDQGVIEFSGLVGNTSLGKNMQIALQEKTAGALSIEATGTLHKNTAGEEVVDPENFEIEGLDFVMDSGIVRSRVENILN